MTWFVDVLGRAFSADGFVPRRVCGLWPDWLVWEHVAGNALVWLAYVAMPVMIWRLGVRRPEWTPFKGVVLAFALFIALCGLGHFLDMLAFFHPMYRLSGHVLIVTGLVSWWTAWSLRRAWPVLMAMRGPAELERVIVERTEELKRTIDDLRRAEADRAYLATLVESSGDAIVGKDLDGVVISWNAGAERLFGYTAAEAIGRPITFLFPPDRQDEEPAILERLRRGETVDHFESVRVTRDGRSIGVSLTISPIKDRSGRIIGISKIARDITERMAAEDAHRLAEEKMRSVVNHVIDGIITIDERGTLQSFNPAAERIFGYAAAEVLGRNVSMLMPEPYHREHDGYLANYHRTGQPKVIGIGREVEGRRGDGSTFPMELAVSGFRLGEGPFYTGIVRDITERKQAEEALRRSEEKFRQLADAMPQIVWTAGPDGDVDYYNERWYEFTGNSRDGGGDKSWKPVLHPADVRRCLDVWYRAVETGEPYQIEYRLKNGQTGEYRWHLGRALPVKDASGRVARWIGTCTNIDDQKRTEAALRDSEERFRKLSETLERRIEARTAELTAANQALRLSEERFRGAFDAAAIGMALVAPDGRWLQVNASLCQIVGYSEDELLGMTWKEITHPDDLDADLEHARRLLAGEIRSYQMEKRYIHKDGHIVWIVLSRSLVRDAGGEPLHFVAQIEDITPRKQAEEKLQDQTLLLESILEQMADAVVVADRKGSFLIFNQAARKLHGLGPAGILPDDWSGATGCSCPTA